MTEFARLHPTVCFAYYLAATILAVSLQHPVCVALSFAGSFCYLMAVDRTGLRFFTHTVLPVFLLAALVNPLFSHAGMTVLVYLPSGNPLTLESILYGLDAAGILAAMLCLCACMAKVMDQDKWVCVLGRMFPSLSLVLAMAFRFVPRLKKQAVALYETQNLLEDDSRKLFRKIRFACRVLGMLVTKTFENAIDTSFSMKARGYGSASRTAYSPHKFGKRDAGMLAALSALALGTLGASKALAFRFYPSVVGEPLTLGTVLPMVSYGLFCLLPVIYEETEVLRWKSIMSKI